jgi:uncharacterized protein YigE (DUF2233 family)
MNGKSFLNQLSSSTKSKYSNNWVGDLSLTISTVGEFAQINLNFPGGFKKPKTICFINKTTGAVHAVKSINNSNMGPQVGTISTPTKTIKNVLNPSPDWAGLRALSREGRGVF